MLKFCAWRIAEAVPVLLAIATLSFFLVRLTPGGPFDTEREVPAIVQENLNEKYHLDDPLYRQYLDYMADVLRGDLGPSFKYPHSTVNELLADGFPVSMELGLWALLVALALGLAAGVAAAMRPNRWGDYVPMSLAMIGICVPSFVLGPLLVLVFALHLDWFDVSGWDDARDRVLPAFTLGAVYAAYIARLSRGSMLETMAQDFITTARAKGVSELGVVLRHALRRAILPVVAFIGPAAAGLITGSFVVESIFQIPGIGRHFINAALQRDYTVVIGFALFYGLIMLLLNLVVDIVQAFLNPRLSYE